MKTQANAHQYCTYLTVYRGSALPPFYIGSTSVDKVNQGYRGSVRSSAYAKIWKRETVANPQLFDTRIISVHDTRKKALERENELHIKLSVVKNPLYVNQSIASGCFGAMTQESLAKMIATKNEPERKIKAGRKVSAKRNDPEWKATTGEIARQKLIKTKNDPDWIATLGKQRNEKNRATVTSQEWKDTVGKERSKKISMAVRLKQDNDAWRSTIGAIRKAKMMDTINNPEWKATVQAEANKKRSISVSKTRSDPAWKLAHMMTCEHCDKTVPSNIFARYHGAKCKTIKEKVCI